MLDLLAQSFFSAPDPLPGAGFLETWLIGRSLVTGAVLAVLGVVVLAGPGRRSRGGAVAGGVLVLAAAAVLIAGRVIVTERGAVLARADGFYAAVAGEGDPGAYLGPRVGLALGGKTTASEARGLILSGAERLRGSGLRSLTAEERQAEVVSGSAARTQTQLRVEIEGGGPNLVWVRLDWRREPGAAWMIRGVDVELINGETPGPEVGRAVR